MAETIVMSAVALLALFFVVALILDKIIWGPRRVADQKRVERLLLAQLELDREALEMTREAFRPFRESSEKAVKSIAS